MSDNRSKQILDSTFLHLEKAIEEMRREKVSRERKSKEKASERKSTDAEKK